MITTFRRSPVRGYLLAVLSWLAATVMRYALDHYLTDGFPFLTFFPAVVLVTYLAGIKAGVLTAVLSGMTAWGIFMGPVPFATSTAVLLAMLLFVFIVCVDIFFIDGMERERARAELESERSRDMAQRQAVLMEEVQHRISNNLLVVSALLALQGRNTDDPASRKNLNEARDRVSVIAKIQRALYSASGNHEPILSVAENLLKDALEAADRSDITYAVTGDEVVLPPDQVTPVALIFLECVNNALEHAFADRAGHIEVRLETVNGERVLSVTDDGPGLGAAPAAGASPSLGLTIANSLAKQLSGAFSIADGPAGGAVARLSWPVAT